MSLTSFVTTAPEDEGRRAAWHVHDCTFQMVSRPEWMGDVQYDRDQGRRQSAKGDCINQIPGIPHRELGVFRDCEVLEIVAPADFQARVVEAPTAQAQAAGK